MVACCEFVAGVADLGMGCPYTSATISRRNARPDSVGTVYDNDLRQRYAPVSDPADVRQDGLAAAGRHARRVEHLHGLLSSHAAAGLLVCTPEHAAVGPAAPGDASRCGDAGPADPASDRNSPGLDAAGRGQPGDMAALAADRFGGIAVFRGFGQQSAAAEVVFGHGESGQRRPLLSLRGQQLGQHAGVARLPTLAGAHLAARRPGVALGGRVRDVDSLYVGLCTRGLADDAGGGQ